MLRIGNYCSIAEGVTIMLGGEHRTDWVTTYPFSALERDAAVHVGHPRSKGDVTLGHDVWVGRDALVLSGVSVGDGAVIGAGSLVTKSVEPYTIVGGNPAQVLRQRFSSPLRDALLRIAWWDWPEERIREAWPMLLSDDVAAFVAAYDPGP
jgi:virginiamycin A acetyltransferase